MKMIIELVSVGRFLIVIATIKYTVKANTDKRTVPIAGI